MFLWRRYRWRPAVSIRFSADFQWRKKHRNTGSDRPVNSERKNDGPVTSPACDFRLRAGHPSPPVTHSLLLRDRHARLVYESSSSRRSGAGSIRYVPTVSHSSRKTDETWLTGIVPSACTSPVVSWSYSSTNCTLALGKLRNCSHITTLQAN